MKGWNRKPSRIEPREERPLKLRVRLMSASARMPTRGTPGSAGLDIYSTEDRAMEPGDIVGIHPGIAMEIPEGHVGLLCTRSSMGKIGVRIAAGCNVIDSDYRGEVMVYLRNDGAFRHHIYKGDRIAQIVVLPLPAIEVEEALCLSDTERGEGGFGSTGR